MIVKIYKRNSTKQVAEIPMKSIVNDGWQWEEFVGVQLMLERDCIVVEGGKGNEGKRK